MTQVGVSLLTQVPVSLLTHTIEIFIETLIDTI